MAANEFINVPFTISNLDRFTVRTSILNALRSQLSQLNGRLLDAGCGKMPYRDYILKNSAVTQYVGLDIASALVYDKSIKPDFTWDGKVMPFENDSFESAMATEVLEHCPDPELFLKEIHRVLAPGGKLFFTVPFLWNLHETPHDEYRYTPFSLRRHLENSGFTEITIEALGGWHASMAQMLGLWVRRSKLKKYPKRILSVFFKPIIAYLLKLDKKKVVTFSEGSMITGLMGIAKKKH